MRFLPGAAALVAALALLMALGADPTEPVVLTGLGLALLWLLLPVHTFGWWSHVSLAAFTGLAATALLRGGVPAWTVVAQMAALAAWDLAAPAQMRARHPVDHMGLLLRRRLIPLGVIAAVTVAAAVLAGRVSFTLTLPWALLLGLALIILLARIVRQALNPFAATDQENPR